MNKCIPVMFPLLFCAMPINASMYINLGAGGVFSHSKSGFTENSTSILFAPTAIGTSLFTLPNVNWENHFKNGFDLNAAAGYHLNDHWRAEGEFVYQNIQRISYGTYGWLEQNAVTGAVYAVQTNNPISNNSTRAHIYSLLSNAAYDFNSRGDWTPFISGGIGISWLRSQSVTTHDIINIDDPNTPLIETAPANQYSPSLYGTAFTWQFKAGLARHISEHINASIQYRVLGTTDFKASNSLIKTNPGVPGESNFYIAQHDIKGLLTQAVELNMRWDV